MKFKEYSTATDTYTTLPAEFQTSGADVDNYQFFGASSGVGEETENLVDVSFFTNNYSLDVNTGLPALSQYDRICTVSPINVNDLNTVTLSWSTEFDDNVKAIYSIFNNGTLISRTANVYKNTAIDVSSADEMYISLYNGISSLTVSDVNYVMLVSGSTAPTTYIPFGYKIPILMQSGVTENLVSDIITHANITSSGEIVSLPVTTPTQFDISIAEVELGKEYTFVTNDGEESVFAFYTNFPQVGEISYNNSRTVMRGLTQTFTSPIDGYICVRSYNGFDQVMVVEGSTPPDHYIPHRYESNYDLFIGDSKLYEDEYVDYQEQKIYRTILLTTHDNKNFITSDNNRFCVRRSNNG